MELEFIFTLLSFLGLGLLYVRLRPRERIYSDVHDVPSEAHPLVSIIIPARNEESTLPSLLASLKQIQYPRVEIIVVDDQSTDATATLAEEFAVTLVRGQERPAGWRGKQWACHQGAAIARGDYLLFTDADTQHYHDSLGRILDFQRQLHLDLTSAIPYHANPTFWEQCLGPFHLLLMSVTNPYGIPQRRKLFAVGQYLLFKRSAYQAIGGHSAVRDRWVEDLPLANLCLESGLRYGVYPKAEIFAVRMYANFAEFIAGWRRNFRAGFVEASPTNGVEVLAMIAALTGSGQFFATWTSTCTLFLSWAIVLRRQNNWGRFSLFGVILLPLSLALFTVISALALFDLLFQRKLVWKGREYQIDPKKGAC